MFLSYVRVITPSVHVIVFIDVFQDDALFTLFHSLIVPLKLIFSKSELVL